MKKIIINSTIKEERKIITDNKLNIDIELYTNIEKQINILYKIYNNEEFFEKQLIVSQIKNKINNYKSQDIKKDIHDYENLISFDNIIKKMISSKLECHYCNIKTYILYNKVREPRQWTLDRINNFDEHTNTNTVICCLSCNISRRRKNSTKFLFTKQLVINKI